jgi:hypothetical protein
MLGRVHPAFFGSQKKCYESYLLFCYRQRPLPEKGAIVKTARIFHQQRRKQHIGCEKGFLYHQLILLS